MRSHSPGEHIPSERLGTEPLHKVPPASNAVEQPAAIKVDRRASLPEKADCSFQKAILGTNER